MNLFTTLNVQLVDSLGAHLEMSEVLIDVVFYFGSRERYTFVAGVTDHRGALSASYRDVESTRLENQSSFLRDYNTGLDECDRTIALRIPTVSELEARRLVIIKWFPANLLEIKRIAHAANEKVVANGFRVEVGDGISPCILFAAKLVSQL